MGREGQGSHASQTPNPPGDLSSRVLRAARSRHGWKELGGGAGCGEGLRPHGAILWWNISGCHDSAALSMALRHSDHTSPERGGKRDTKGPQTTILTRVEHQPGKKHPLRGGICGQAQAKDGLGSVWSEVRGPAPWRAARAALPHQVYRMRAAPPHRGRRVG